MYSTNQKIDDLVDESVKDGWKFHVGGAHGKLISPCGKKWIIVPKTPSDRRAQLNFAMDLRRIKNQLEEEKGVISTVKIHLGDSRQVYVVSRRGNEGCVITLSVHAGLVQVSKVALNDNTLSRTKKAKEIGDLPSFAKTSAHETDTALLKALEHIASFINARAKAQAYPKDSKKQSAIKAWAAVSLACRLLSSATIEAPEEEVQLMIEIMKTIGDPVWVAEFVVAHTKAKERHSLRAFSSLLASEVLSERDGA
jgi:hypothetical protein